MPDPPFDALSSSEAAQVEPSPAVTSAEALRTSEIRYRRLFETARDGILILDTNHGKITDANPFMTELLGYSHDELIGKELWEIGLLRDKDASQEAFQVLLQKAFIRYEDLPLENQRGEQREVEFVSNVYREDERAVIQCNIRAVIQCNIRDITKRRKTEKALASSEERLSLILANIEDIVFLLNVEASSGGNVKFPDTYRFLFVNASFLDWTGLKDDQIIGRRVQDVRSKSARAVVLGKCAETVRNRHPVTWQEISSYPSGERTGEVRLLPLFDERGRCSHIIGTIHDITERRRIEQEKEQHLWEAQERADRDPLTGLLNHRAFYNKLDLEAAHAQHENTTLAVVMLDLDSFKFFNDAYGHAMGDEVLRLVAERLRAICRTSDTLARFGGDEFVLLLPNIGQEEADQVESRLKSGLHGLSYKLDGQERTIPIAVSVGTGLLLDKDADPDEILRQADERLRFAKSGGSDGEDAARRVRADIRMRVQGFSMLDALVTAVDNKDRYTCHHSESVMEYSLMIAQKMGIDEAQQHTVAVSALLHDVGKIGVPDAILRKPGSLTEDEFEAIKQHPTMGAALVSTVPGLEATLDAVRHHHERWDGGGYPSGLRGEECPLNARLMAVADAFSAMTTDRPYRVGMDTQKALSILVAGSGTQWDPACVDAFVSGLPHP